MNARKVNIKCFGCQMNKLDSTLVASALGRAGFAISGNVENADIVLINTCSVRRHAEQRVFSHLGHLKHIKQKRPELIVGVIGCMAQRLGVELFEHKAVDIVCGSTQIPKIPELINKALGKQCQSLAVTEQIRKPDNKNDKALDDFESAYSTAQQNLSSQAFVRIMRGCNKFCSYCVVPYVRGPEVSRNPKTIVEQAKRLSAQGVKQITLLGQAVNCYKYATCGKMYCLADVLYEISKISGIEWVKFITSYPTDIFYDQILQAMAGLTKVCNYLHMPAQCGSDKMLKAMNRKYSVNKYLELIERAKERVPGIEIAGDFIVGYPEESEEIFAGSVSLVKKVRYKNIFVFKYSPRPGTKAEKYAQDDISQEVKRRRNMELLAVQEEISGHLAGEFLGKTVRVLVEGPSKKAHLEAENKDNHYQLVGRTAEDWIVVFGGTKELAGEFVDVKITKTSPLTLFGELT
ncbi:MAG: tRNA (N6-isopentenyl adenosine(37)-C2)-methylthiotransferase MiaB [Sedimentisphaerales bacterium]|nr:tRNA (N6-isopentenyl adenosine(37)-C2)-methylthiotransferase MiaB [Sedimentisphaerales bacterium]